MRTPHSHITGQITGLVTGLITGLVLAAPAFAQETEGGMAPAPENQKFHVLLGNWKGSGTVRHTVDTDAQPWTGESTVKSILGGHFIEESTRIDLGEAAPAALYMKSVMGFDRETKRWMQYGINNMGEANETEVHWEDGKMLSGTVATKEGKLTVERWVTTFHGKDKYSFVGYMSHGGGKTFEHVKGTMERVKVANASFKPTKAPAMMPAAEQMTAMHKMAGTYKLEGWMIPAPGAPKVEITALEYCEPIFGGTGLQVILKGDPIPQMGTYEGCGFTVWNPKKQCYSNLWFSNMGECAMHDAWIKDGKLIGTMALIQMGNPAVSRSLTTLNEDGSLKAYDGHSIIAGHEPVYNFHCTYTKQ